MNKGCIGAGVVVAGIIVILAIIGISKYNHMITLDNDVKAQWGNVNNAYQKRSDLVPNLVATVKGSADFEKGTLTDVIEQRANATKTVIDPNNLSQEAIDRYQQAQSGLGGALGRLLVSVERYPDLKASQGFLNLQNSLESIEAEILHERKNFNEKAKVFNNYTEGFPNVIIASIFPRFAPKGYFNAEAGAEKNPEVNFDFGE